MQVVNYGPKTSYQGHSNKGDLSKILFDTFKEKISFKSTSSGRFFLINTEEHTYVFET